MTDPLEALFRHGRLVTIPRRGTLRRALFARLAERFEPGVLYTETDVRERLAPIHDDHAALRRHLVDAGLLQRSRDGGVYGRPAESRPGPD
ncbi:DUF2087 domain-containing protein [Amycolatopsis samaneae]|uniref:DUF2087 domain-containing protein n=1 Tax=Amycolatopsis samaneae TaxID=664691 RepID=A0ABW5GUH5_9PSEU